MSQSLITIVIPTYNHLEDALKPCIEKLLRYTDMSNKEVVVVANGCNDGTIAYLENLKHDKVRFIEIKEPCGYIRAVNAGIKDANTEYVILLDNDAFLLDQNVDDWINYLYKPFIEDDLVGASGACAYRYREIGTVIQSCCAMYRRKLLVDLNYFAEDYNPGYFSDYDICARINKTKYKCVGVPRVLEDYDLMPDGTMYFSPFPLYHGSVIQTMNKHKDRDLVLKNRSLFYRRHRNYEIYDICMWDGNIKKLEERVLYLHDMVDRFIFVHDKSVGFDVKTLKDNLCLRSVLHKIEIANFDTIENIFAKFRVQPRDLCILSSSENIVTKEQLNDSIETKKYQVFASQKDNADLGMIGEAQEMEQKYMELYRKEIKYSIIIPTYNNFSTCLHPCIESILANTNLRNTEVIVVANGCVDETKSYLDSKKDVIKTIWYDQPLGYTKATNIGIQQAVGEYLILLNNDNQILDWGKNTWIQTLQQPFFADPKVAITGATKSYHGPTNSDFLLFYCVMIPRTIIEKLGLLDESFNPGYGEDIDYCIRAKNAGYKIVQVPFDREINSYEALQNNVCNFPIWHQGSKTVHHVPGWNEIVDRNENILIQKYMMKKDKTIDIESLINTYKEQSIGLYQEIFEFNFYHVQKHEIENKNVLDVGANIGAFSLLCKKLGAKNVIAFEPDDKYFEKLQNNLGNVDGIDCRKEAVFAENIGEAFLDLSYPCPKVTESTTDLKIKCSGLHDVISQFEGDNDLVMKLDCEASEYDIIFGSRKEDILRFKTIYAEIHNNMHENASYNHEMLINYLVGLGYDAVELKQNNVYPGYWCYNPQTGQHDIFVPAEQVANTQDNRGFNNHLYKFTRIEKKSDDYGEKESCKYSIIIPTYNHLEDCLKPCVESIRTYTDLSNVEVIIVANGCTDGTREYIQNLPSQFKIIWHDEALGYTRATNIGIKAAKGEYLVLLNNDTVLMPQPTDTWLNLMVQPFLNDSDVAVTGPLGNYCPDANETFMIFFCVMISKKAMLDVGLLDEIFSPGFGEDTDFCMRAKNLGYKIVQVPVGEKLQVVEVADNRLHMYADGKTQTNTGTFPIYHKGEGTFENWGNEHAGALNKNKKTLSDRYRNLLSLDRAKRTTGWMTDSELQFLAHQSRLHRTIIEVGSWHGRSATAIVENMPENAILYCIDTWNGTPNEKSDTNTFHATADLLDGDYVYNHFMSNMFEYIQKGKVIPIRMHSEHAASLLKNKNVIADMIFIDAGHTYEDVKKDIISWMPLLRSNGILCGHDYHVDGVAWPGVHRAVHEMFNNVRNVTNTGIWQIRKEW